MTKPQPEVVDFERALAEAEDLAHLTFAAKRVLAMSAALFYRYGVGGTSVRDITSACGLTPGALYNHFGSKDDVLYALVQHGHDAIDGRIRAAVAAADPSCPAQLAAFVEAYVSSHLENPRMAQLARREYTYLSDARRDEIVGRRRRLRQQLARVLDDGEQQGDFVLIGGRDRATRSAVMILDMCSRTSEWFHPDANAGVPIPDLTSRYVQASLRLVGARLD